MIIMDNKIKSGTVGRSYFVVAVFMHYRSDEGSRGDVAYG